MSSKINLQTCEYACKSSIFQDNQLILHKYIDRDWNDKDLKVILCGSALSFMEKKVLSEKSPLFGRCDSQIKLEAFNYLDAAKFVPNYSNEDKAICYGIFGYIPCK